MTKLITFTDDKMTKSAEICKKSSLENNVTEVEIFNPDDISKNFFDKNKEVLSNPRGAGLWLWKPYFINRELNKLKDGDVLIYCDAGVQVIQNVNYIIDRMVDDIWLFGNLWKHVEWCKGDVLNEIIPVWKDGRYNDIKQVQASVIFIKVSDWSKKFVKEWLRLCCLPGMIDDSASKSESFTTFQEHRHDQAILTCLQIKYGLPLHWWPAIYNDGAFTYEKTGFKPDYPVLFNHHRKRNEEWIT